MALRHGDGTRVTDLNTALAEWRKTRRSPSIYCSRRDHETFTEDLGELVATLPDGTEIRRHANLKASTYRTGNPKIAFNRIVIGNPKAYAEWVERTKDLSPDQQGYMPQWTYYPDRDFDEIMERYTKTETTSELVYELSKTTY